MVLKRRGRCTHMDLAWPLIILDNLLWVQGREMHVVGGQARLLGGGWGRIKEAGWLPTKAARASLHGALRDPAKWFAIMSTGTSLVNLCSEFVDTFGQPSLPPKTKIRLKNWGTYEVMPKPTHNLPRVELCVWLPMFTRAWVGGGEWTSHGTAKTLMFFFL